MSKLAATSAVNRIHLHCSLLAAVLALALYRFFLLDSSDRYKCNALLESGRWLDSHFTNWQPDGCMLYPYRASTVSDCLKDRRVVFIGDSIVRNLFYETVAIVDPKVDTNGDKHSDRAITAGGVRWEFYWDPFLDSKTWDALLTRTQGRTGPPTLLVVGAGLWHLRQEKPLAEWSTAMDNLFTAVTGPEASQNPIADEVVLLPVETLVGELLSAERQATITREAVAKLNADLAARVKTYPRPNIAFTGVFNEMLIGADSLTPDGMHYDRRMVAAQARILMNLRCNDVLVKKFPLDKTCCSQYPAPNWVQVLLLVLLVAYAPLAMHLGPGSLYAHWFPASEYLIPISVFGFSIMLVFFGDRTSLFLKEGKQYDTVQFAALNLAALAAGLLTLKKPEKGDLGFLNRDQTDEWKGWMQIAILIYHYLGASKISGIYNPIRVCVAAYLFMSGYGHFFYYYKKADYSFKRVFAVIVRLNLLTLVLAYVMDTDYLSYYFSPLVTMWFGIIWVTMYVGHQWNGRVLFVVPKLIASAAMVSAFFHYEAPLAATFRLVNSVFKTEWYAREWAFRVTLDMYIVYWGMLAALVFIKVKEYKLTDHPSWPTAYKAGVGASAAAMLWFFAFELTRPNKLVYNVSHPYTSVLPVVAFAVLRNATPALRSTSSRFFIYFGQCSLETFIIQFHLWLAADTKGLLMVLPFTRWRAANFVVSSLVFVFLSNQVALATGGIADWLCNKPPAGSQKLPTSRGPPVGSPSNGSGSATAGPEYIAMSSVAGPVSGGGVSDDGSGIGRAEDPEKAALEAEMAAMPLGDGRPRASGAAALADRLVKLVKEDLRLKAAALLFVMWLLNLVFPGDVAEGHVLPTH